MRKSRRGQTDRKSGLERGESLSSVIIDALGRDAMLGFDPYRVNELGGLYDAASCEIRGAAPYRFRD